MIRCDRTFRGENSKEKASQECLTGFFIHRIAFSTARITSSLASSDIQSSELGYNSKIFSLIIVSLTLSPFVFIVLAMLLTLFFISPVVNLPAWGKTTPC
jgi:hypothetical protein